MKNRGFTLVELLGVIVVLVVLSLVAFPLIANQFTKSKGKISNATISLVEEAASLYVDERPNDYEKTNGNQYCISLGQLIQDGKLNSPFVDSSTGKEISSSKEVQVTVSNNQFHYQFLTEGECQS